MRLVQLIMSRASDQCLPTCSVLFGRLGVALVNALHSITEDSQFRALPMYGHDDLVMIRRGVLVLVTNYDRVPARQSCRHSWVFLKECRNPNRNL